MGFKAQRRRGDDHAYWLLFRVMDMSGQLGSEAMEDKSQTAMEEEKTKSDFTNTGPIHGIFTPMTRFETPFNG